MNKYKSGNLFVVYFDSYGARQTKETCVNYMDGRAKIRAYLKDHPDHSGILERVIFNSKDEDKLDTAE